MTDSYRLTSIPGSRDPGHQRAHAAQAMWTHGASNGHLQAVSGEHPFDRSSAMDVSGHRPDRLRRPRPVVTVRSTPRSPGVSRTIRQQSPQPIWNL
jgi:hypothetical protein